MKTGVNQTKMNPEQMDNKCKQAALNQFAACMSENQTAMQVFNDGQHKPWLHNMTEPSSLSVGCNLTFTKQFPLACDLHSTEGC